MLSDKLLAAILIVSSARAQTAAEDRSCGAYCLGVVLTQSGLERPPFEELERLVEEDTEGKSSMLAVARAIEKSGLDVRVHDDMPKTPPGLSVGAMKVPAGGHSENHFVVFERLDSQSVFVYSPPFWTAKRTWSQAIRSVDAPLLVVTKKSGFSIYHSLLILIALVAFTGAWMVIPRRKQVRRLAVPMVSLGLVLLLCVGCSKASVPVRPVGGQYQDIGLINIGEPQPLEVINNSTHPIRVRGFRSSCGCGMLNIKDGDVLPVGRSNVMLSLQAREGERRDVTFRLLLDCEDQPECKFGVSFLGGPSTAVQFDKNLDCGEVDFLTDKVVVLKYKMLAGAKLLADAKNAIEVIGWQSTNPPALSIESTAPGIINLESVKELECRCRITPRILGYQSAYVFCYFGQMSLATKVSWRAVGNIEGVPTTMVLRRKDGKYVASTVLGNQFTGVLPTLLPIGLSITSNQDGEALTIYCEADERFVGQAAGIACVDLTVAMQDGKSLRHRLTLAADL